MENQPKKRNSTENVPRRERFLFDNLEHTMNYHRHKSASSVIESNDLPQEKNKQVFLKMPSDFREAYMQIVNQVTYLFNEMREGLQEITPSSEVTQTIFLVPNSSSPSRKFPKFKKILKILLPSMISADASTSWGVAC